MTRNRQGNFRVPEGAPMGDDWEQLQDVLQWLHNRRVIEEFRDLTPDDQEWVASLSTPRARLRWASTIKEDDSAIMVLNRMFLFYILMGGAAAMQTPMYTIPVTGFQEAKKFQPQIQLEFSEDLNEIQPGYKAVTGVISFRLARETSESITRADVERYAMRVRTLFGATNGFLWHKGKSMASYTDREKGYKLQLLVRNETEARRVIEKVLEVQDHTPDWSKLNISKNELETERFPPVPERRFILGESRRQPRQRPTASVRFKRAFLHIWGLQNPITLVDMTGYHRNAVAS